MDNTQFEAHMRQGERFHSLRLPPEHWPILRVDGHCFSRFTAAHFTKPFDPAFHDSMVQTAQALIEGLGGIYAYTESDEISVLLPRNWTMFDRSQEKAVSISAGMASAVFTRASGKIAHFDSRVWLGGNPEEVIDYFQWRQSDAARCALNGWCYWTLRQKGANVKESTEALEGRSTQYKQDLLLRHGVDFEQVPGWQRQGVGLYWETFEKEGHNPLTNETVATVRRRVTVDANLPVGAAYAGFIEALLYVANPNDS